MPVVAAAPPVVVDLSPLPPPSVTAMVAMVRQWLDLAVPPTTGVRSGDATVVSALSSLLGASYKSERGTEILNSDNLDMSWLTQVVKHPPWRKAIVDFAKGVPTNDRFVHSVVVPTVAHNGYHKDVLVVPSALSQYFVFEKVAKEVFAQHFTVHGSKLAASTEESVDVMSRHELATLVSLQFLRDLDGKYSRPSGDYRPVPSTGSADDVLENILKTGPGVISRVNLHRLRQDVEQRVLSSVGPADAQLRVQLLAQYTLSPCEVLPEWLGLREALTGVWFQGSRAGDAVVAASGRPSSFASHVATLAQAYWPATWAPESGLGSTSDVPPSSYLRRFGLMKRLLVQLFDPSVLATPEHLDRMGALVAVSACVVDADAGDLAPLNANYKLAGTLRDTLARLSSEVRTRELVAEFSRAGDKTPLETAALEWPCVGAGALIWVRHLLLRGLASSTAVCSHILDFVIELSQAHVLLLPQCCALAQDLFMLPASEWETYDMITWTEFQKNVLKMLVTWMVQGYTIPVLKFLVVCHQGQTMDAMLTRYFLSRVLGAVAPPYSEEFLAAMVELLQMAPVKAALAYEVTVRAAKDEFVASARKTVWPEPLQSALAGL